LRYCAKEGLIFVLTDSSNNGEQEKNRTGPGRQRKGTSTSREGKKEASAENKEKGEDQEKGGHYKRASRP